MSEDVTNNEILKRIDSLSGTVTNLSGTVNNLSETVNDLSVTVNDLSITVGDILATLQTFATSVDNRFDEVWSELKGIKSQMITKDYLDRKLWNLKGDLVVMIKREIEGHELDLHA